MIDPMRKVDMFSVYSTHPERLYGSGVQSIFARMALSAPLEDFCNGRLF